MIFQAGIAQDRQQWSAQLLYKTSGDQEKWDWKSARGITALLLGLFAEFGGDLCHHPGIIIVASVMTFISCMCEIVNCQG